MLMRDQFGALEYQEMVVKEAFKLLDKDGNGYIDYEELRSVLRAKGEALSEEEFQQVIDELDANKDGRIDYEGQVEHSVAMISLWLMETRFFFFFFFFSFLFSFFLFLFFFFQFLPFCSCVSYFFFGELCL